MDDNRFRKVLDAPDYVKDMHTNAILNTNNVALQAYKRQKKALSDASKNTERLDKLEKDVDDIKDLLTKILGKLS